MCFSLSYFYAKENVGALILVLLGFGFGFCILHLVSIDKRNCPKCGSNLGNLKTLSGGLFKISHNIKFCPYCGLSLDTAIDNLAGKSSEPILPLHTNKAE